MQYLVSVIFDDPTNSATPTELAAIDAYSDRLKAEAHWVFAGGLNSPSTATVIDNRSGEARFTDRPLPGDEGVSRRLLDHRGRRPRRGAHARRREHLGGFAVVEVPTREAALEWAATIAVACRCALRPDPTR